MKTLTAEETKYLETLNTVAGEITQRIVSACDEHGNPKYAHMIDMWKAFLGGFICKEMGELTEIDDEQKALIAEYSPEAIEKMLTKEVIKEVKVDVEKIVYRDKLVEVPVNQANVSSNSGSPVKERRRFNQRTRGTEKNRELMPAERVFMIEKFNEIQRLLDRNSTEARDFAASLNKTAEQYGYKTIYPSQLAGYWSVLCKRVCGIDGDVVSYMSLNRKNGKLPDNAPSPYASDDFKKVILENLINSKEEAKRVGEYQKIYREFGFGNPPAPQLV